jgi:hypothetical protein
VNTSNSTLEEMHKQSGFLLPLNQTPLLQRKIASVLYLGPFRCCRSVHMAFLGRQNLGNGQTHHAIQLHRNEKYTNEPTQILSLLVHYKPRNLILISPSLTSSQQKISTYLQGCVVSLRLRRSLNMTHPLSRQELGCRQTRNSCLSNP